VKSRVKAILVMDGNGDELTLYEVRGRGALFGLLPSSRFVLGSGEAVVKSGNGYAVVATGEKLMRICKER
jgi:hypothetical protein